ncbi:MAG TPA: hypothetical protein VE987_18820, partial [Polyangiaceae bacterium]|nr:hypothetical protein [Polyangiaceae bacterium]
IALAISPDAASPAQPSSTAAPPAPPAPSAPPPPKPPVPPARPAPSSPPDAAVTRGWLRFDVRARLDVASSDGLLAPGLAMGVTAGRGAIGARAVCGWLSGVSMGVPGEAGTVTIERVPCAVGATVRVVPEGARWQVDAGAGVAAGAVQASGHGFGASYETARLEVGARAGVDVAYRLGAARGFAPVVGLEATYYPRPYDLDVLPRGVVAQTPSFWAGVTAGVCWSIE